MPTVFLYTGREYEEYMYEEEWRAASLFFGNTSEIYSDNKTVTQPGTTDFTISLPSEDVYVSVLWDDYPAAAKNYLYFYHWWYTWYPFTDADDIEPYPVTKTYVLENEADNVSVFWASCVHKEYLLQIHYDEATYSSLENAWDSGELYVWIGVGNVTAEYELGTTNAWTLISRLMLFQAPEIHPGINAIIAIPLWAAISYTAFSLLMKLVHGGD